VHGLGDELLAGTGLTADEHRHVLRRDLLDDPEHLLHPRIARPHPVELDGVAVVTGDGTHVDDPATRARSIADRHGTNPNLLVGPTAGTWDHRVKRSTGGECFRERALGAIAAEYGGGRRADRRVEPEDGSCPGCRNPDAQLVIEHECRADELVERVGEQDAIEVSRRSAGSWTTRHVLIVRYLLPFRVDAVSIRTTPSPGRTPPSR
jgi:hypothetical protein